MIWSSIPSDEKLRLWKKLRSDITPLTTDEKLVEVAKFCLNIPFGSRSLDYYSPWDWPNPWEILYYESFCTSSISLLMFYTLVMVDETLDIELILVEDDDGLYLLPVIENQFVLNYELGKVNKISEINDDFRVSQRYPKNSVKTIK